MGVGVGKMCPEWLKGGRWPTGAMCPARAAALKGEAFSCMHLDSSSKHSAPFLFFLDLVDIFRFLVWIPSFFMVSGLFTWGQPQNCQGGLVPFPEQDPTPQLPHGAKGGSGLGTPLANALGPARVFPSACRPFKKGLFHCVGPAGQAVEPTKCQHCPPSTQPNSTPTFCFKKTPLPQTAAVEATLAASLPPLMGSPSGTWGLPARGTAASQAKPRWRLWLGPRAWQHKEPRSPGRGGAGQGGADSHCAACSRGHRRCRQGPRWRFGAIRWWLSSDNLHNRCRLSWRPTGRGGWRQQAGLPRPSSTSLPDPHPNPPSLPT